MMMMMIFQGVVTLCSAPSNPPLLHHPHSKGDHEDTNKYDDDEAIGQGQTNRLGEIQNLSLGRCLLCRPPQKKLEKSCHCKINSLHQQYPSLHKQNPSLQMHYQPLSKVNGSQCHSYMWLVKKVELQTKCNGMHLPKTFVQPLGFSHCNALVVNEQSWLTFL